MSAKRRRRRSFQKRHPLPGTAPGTLQEWEGEGARPKLRVVDYDRRHFAEKDDANVEDCRRAIEDPTISWVHVQGRMAPDKLKLLGEQFGLHALALEDVLNTPQRPKAEVYGDELFAILALPRYAEDGLAIEQVSLFLGPHYVISFHEGQTDPFEPVRARLRSSAKRFQERGADYLFYTLVDVVIDHVFPLLEQIGDRVDELETVLYGDAEKTVLPKIHALKRDLVQLRRFLWPQRELVAALHRDDRDFFAPETRPYVRDCYDHSVQIMDLLETYREMTGNLLELYLSSMSHRMNEAMRFLTVISTTFIPLSFLVGVYGMNFEHMPELKVPWAYPAVWAVIFTTAGGLLLYFRSKRWF